MATECVHIQHPPVCWDTVCNCSYLTVGCPYSHRTLLLWQLFLSSFPLAFLTSVLALGNNKVFILLLHSEVQHSFVWYRTRMSFDHREHKLRLEPMDSLKRLSSPCSPWIQTASSFHQHGLLPIAVWVPQCMVCWRKDIAEAENKAAIDIFPFHSQKVSSLPHKRSTECCYAMILLWLFIKQFPKTSTPFLVSAFWDFTFPISTETFLILQKSLWSKQIRSFGFVYTGDFTGASTYRESSPVVSSSSRPNV